MLIKLTVLAMIEIALLGLLFLLTATNVGPVFYRVPHSDAEIYANAIGYMEVNVIWIGVLIYIPWLAFKAVRPRG